MAFGLGDAIVRMKFAQKSCRCPSIPLYVPALTREVADEVTQTTDSASLRFALRQARSPDGIGDGSRRTFCRCLSAFCGSHAHEGSALGQAMIETAQILAWDPTGNVAHTTIFAPMTEVDLEIHCPQQQDNNSPGLGAPNRHPVGGAGPSYRAPQSCRSGAGSANLLFAY